MKFSNFLISLFFLVISSTAFSQEMVEKYKNIQFEQIAKYTEHKNTPSVLNDEDVREKLEDLLGKDFNIFSENLETWSVPVVLKNKGIFFDGWKSNSDSLPYGRSAFLIYPDGRVYAAFFEVSTGNIKYYTNDNLSESVHPAFVAWSRNFTKNPNFYNFDGKLISLKMTDPENSIVKRSAIAAANLTVDQQKKLRNVSSQIWGTSATAPWDMNPELGDVVSSATAEILTCSRAFSLVPKPVGFMPGWLYIVSQSEFIIKYFTGLKSSKQYMVCINAAAVNYRTAAEMASAGL